MARSLTLPLQAQIRLLRTSSRTEQLASSCSTLCLTKEFTSKQTRMAPQRLGLHWRRFSSSRRPAAILWHITSSSAFKNTLRSPCLHWLLELRSPCFESRISAAHLSTLLPLMMNSLAWLWFKHLGPNTCISHHPWHCSLILTKTRSRLLSRLKKSIDDLAWMLSLFPQQTQHYLLCRLGAIALQMHLAGSVRSPGTANATAIHSSKWRSTTSQIRARTRRMRKHRHPLSLP